MNGPVPPTQGHSSPEVAARGPGTDSGPYEVRTLDAWAELEACFRLQEEVWGEGFQEAAAPAILKVSQRLDGLVGGALDTSGRLVGFVFGLTGLKDGRPTHWSHMLAVRPGLRDGGLGRRLKAWQRSRCIEMGVREMFWSFDPLESKNGWLNLGRLGAVVGEYVEDMYGVSDSPLHDGLGTDRFIARWCLQCPRVQERLEGRESTPAMDDVDELARAFDVRSSDGWPRPGAPVPMDARAEGVLVPIPADIHALKASDPSLAASWRRATRAALAPPLAQGWEVRELVRAPRGISYYLLRPPAGAGGSAEEPRSYRDDLCEVEE